MISPKRLAIAAGATLFAHGLIGSAAAATSNLPPEVQKAIAQNNRVSHRGAAAAPTYVSGSSLTTVGFATFNATTCATYTSGTTTFVFIYPEQGGYAYTTDPTKEALIAPACTGNNLLGVVVTDTGGTWTDLYVYSHQ